VNASSATCLLPSAPRILIRGTNWLSDAVMTTPALLRLREKFPFNPNDHKGSVPVIDTNRKDG
jgi:hypothetical protein